MNGTMVTLSASFVLLASSTVRGTEPGPSPDERLAAALERKIEESNQLRTAGVGAPAVTDDTTTAPWKWAFGAGSFALLLVGAAVYAKRQREARMLSGSGTGLTIQESIWLGRGQRLLVVHVAGHRYLLGATGGGLETLAELGPAPVADTSAGSEPPAPATFRDLVGQALARESEPRKKRKEILEGLRAL